MEHFSHLGDVINIFESDNAEALMKSVELLKLMSNPHRLAILSFLGHFEMSVTDIGKRVGLGQSALSQHLAKLREHNLVKTRRDRQTIYYSLSSKEAELVIELLHELFCENIQKPPENWPPKRQDD